MIPTVSYGVFYEIALAIMMKSSYFDRYERSHRPIRTLTPTDTRVHIGRCEMTLTLKATTIHTKKITIHINR